MKSWPRPPTDGSRLSRRAAEGGLPAGAGPVARRRASCPPAGAPEPEWRPLLLIHARSSTSGSWSRPSWNHPTGGRRRLRLRRRRRHRRHRRARTRPALEHDHRSGHHRHPQRPPRRHEGPRDDRRTRRRADPTALIEHAAAAELSAPETLRRLAAVVHTTIRRARVRSQPCGSRPGSPRPWVPGRRRGRGSGRRAPPPRPPCWPGGGSPRHRARHKWCALQPAVAAVGRLAPAASLAITDDGRRRWHFGCPVRCHLLRTLPGAQTGSVSS